MSFLDISLPGEIWKPDILTGLPGVMISSLGRVWSPAKLVIHRGAVRRTQPIQARIMAQYSGLRGHRNTSFTINYRECKFPVHRLVCAAFHGPPPVDRPHACHGNNVPDDNRPENLRWDSARNNMLDKWRHGTAQIGERHGNAILTQSLVLHLRAAAARGEEIYNRPESEAFSRAAIWSAVSGRSWRHLPHFGPGGRPVKFKPGGPFGNLNRIGGKKAMATNGMKGLDCPKP